MLDRRQLIILASDHSSSSIVLHECETAHHSNRESTTAERDREGRRVGVCTHTAGSADRISGSCSRGNELLALGASTMRSCILSLSPNHRFSEPRDRSGG